MTDLTTQTPPEIDAQIAELGGQLAKAESRRSSAENAAHEARGERGQRSRFGTIWQTTHADAIEAARAKVAAGVQVIPMTTRDVYAVIRDYDAANAEIDRVRALMAPLDAEFTRRGGWSRFFLVENNGGHIHRSVSCQTCNHNGRRTDFRWLPELSGLTEADAVAAYGPVLCTVCYPSAPLDWTKGKAKPARCEGSGQRPVNGSKRYGRSYYGECPTCHTTQIVTSSGYGGMRAHPPAKTEETPAVDQAAEAPATEQTDAATFEPGTRVLLGDSTGVIFRRAVVVATLARDGVPGYVVDQTGAESWVEARFVEADDEPSAVEHVETVTEQATQAEVTAALAEHVAAPQVARVWLHRPTGAAAFSTLWNHAGGPAAGRGARILDPDREEPFEGGPFSDHTTAQVEAAIAADGWRVITRAEAAAALTAAGYRLTTNRGYVHALYADQADDVTWHTPITEYCVEAFVMRGQLAADQAASATAVDDPDVWVSIPRKGIEYHDIDPDPGLRVATGCGRSTRTGVVMLRSEAIERHQAKECPRCVAARAAAPAEVDQVPAQSVAYNTETDRYETPDGREDPGCRARRLVEESSQGALFGDR